MFCPLLPVRLAFWLSGNRLPQCAARRDWLRMKTGLKHGRRPGREARPTEDSQRDRTEGAKAACEGYGYLEGRQIARAWDWHRPAHLKGALSMPPQRCRL